MQWFVKDLEVAVFRLTEYRFLSILRIAHDKVSIRITGNSVFNVAQNIPFYGIYLRHGIGAEFDILKDRFALRSICTGNGSHRHLISIIRLALQYKRNAVQVWICAIGTTV